MKINNNVSFRVRKRNPIESENRLLKYSIKQLKDHVEGCNVEYELEFKEKENCLMVFTRFFPEKTTHASNSYVSSFNTLKRLDLISREKITEQLKELFDWIKQMNKY